MKKYPIVIGIDVSKNHLDLCLYSQEITESYNVPNNKLGFAKIIKLIKDVNSTLVCLEHTGIYTFPLCGYLSDNNIIHTLIPAAQIKKSLGIQRGKSDKVDAVSIGRYGYLFQDQIELTVLPKKLIIKLKLLYKQRERLIKAKNIVLVPAKEMTGFVDKSLITSIQRTSKQVAINIEKQIDRINIEINNLIKSDSELNKAYQLCQSVPGIGPQITVYLLITTWGFKSFQNARQYACFSGIAPFEYSSGSSIKGKSRVSHLANKKAKTLLSMGAINAIRHDRELKAYFDRKVKEGKHKMAVINAVRNKLISRVFATINRGSPFVKIANY